MKNLYGCTFIIWLVLLSIPVQAELSARAILDNARDQAESAPAIRRVDTNEQSTVVIYEQKRVVKKPQTSVLTIEIDRARNLARQTGTFEGKELVMLKQGEKAAMKRGDGAWEIPTGPFEKIAKDMGNLFVCEIKTPETKETAPVWRLADTELLDGVEAFVIETEGNTAVSLAQTRMTSGIAQTFSGDPAQRPTVKVLEYSSKHWISKTGYRRLKTLQISKYQLTMVAPDGKQLIEQSNTATSQYSYDNIVIEIPEGVEHLWH